MDDSELKQILQKKKQNPRLQRVPLNLGSKFLNFQENSFEIEVPEILTECSVVLLLFGAGWCNITKPFIKQLKKHYLEINLEKKNLEIVFISLDKVKKDYDNIIADMPWIGVHFDDARVKELKQFYNVRAIPELILISTSGNDVYNLKEDQAYEKWKAIKDKEQEVNQHMQ